jgi:hypothetical protein
MAAGHARGWATEERSGAADARGEDVGGCEAGGMREQAVSRGREGRVGRVWGRLGAAQQMGRRRTREGMGGGGGGGVRGRCERGKCDRDEGRQVSNCGGPAGAPASGWSAAAAAALRCGGRSGMLPCCSCAVRGASWPAETRGVPEVRSRTEKHLEQHFRTTGCRFLLSGPSSNAAAGKGRQQSMQRRLLLDRSRAKPQLRSAKARPCGESDAGHDDGRECGVLPARPGYRESGTAQAAAPHLSRRRDSAAARLSLRRR